MRSKSFSGASRREFLRAMGLAAGALLAAACSQAAPAAPTTAPAPAGGATPAAGAAGKSNGTKLTVWGWQSFTPGPVRRIWLSKRSLPWHTRRMEGWTLET